MNMETAMLQMRAEDKVLFLIGKIEEVTKDYIAWLKDTKSQFPEGIHDWINKLKEAVAHVQPKD